jgi:predicted N-acetyltransferase YhbS
MTDDDDDIVDAHEFHCVFCGVAIEDESSAVMLTATWMPHWRADKFAPLAQDFWAHSACLEKGWKGQWPWEEHILYGFEAGADKEYAQSLEISVARPEDREEIEDMLETAFAEGLRRSYGTDLVDAVLPTISKINPKLLTSGTFYVLADMDGQVVASGGWTLDDPVTGEVIEGVAHIRHFAVHPDFSGFGLGRKLFRHCRSLIANAGVREIRCLSGLNAEAFYAKLGFERAGAVDIDLGGVSLPSVDMRRPVKDS